VACKYHRCRQDTGSHKENDETAHGFHPPKESKLVGRISTELDLVQLWTLVPMLDLPIEDSDQAKQSADQSRNQEPQEHLVCVGIGLGLVGMPATEHRVAESANRSDQKDERKPHEHWDKTFVLHAEPPCA